MHVVCSAVLPSRPVLIFRLVSIICHFRLYTPLALASSRNRNRHTRLSSACTIRPAQSLLLCTHPDETYTLTTTLHLNTCVETHRVARKIPRICSAIYPQTAKLITLLRIGNKHIHTDRKSQTSILILATTNNVRAQKETVSANHNRPSSYR